MARYKQHVTWSLVVGLFFVFVTTSSSAQSSDKGGSALYVEAPHHWLNDPALFLEPNRFSVVKELTDRPLWLEVGFGRPIASWIVDGKGGPNSKLVIGLEALAWSRLQVLSDFRFPVETVDYFFGAYVILDQEHASWRLRVSHISSHDVDGKDTVVGGSSSHYSREFVEVMHQIQPWLSTPLTLSVGARAYFHQVTKMEPWFALPVSANIPLFWKGKNSFNLFLSSGDGPVWPSIAGGVLLQQGTGLLDETGTSDLQLYYQYGASWAGTDAGAKRSSINLQMDIRGL